MRYLCNSNAGVINYADCVPKQTHSVAFHGYALNYFQWHNEYPNMGFNHLYGCQGSGNLPLCRHAYNAVNDSDLIDLLIKTTQKNRCNGLFMP